MAGIIDCATVLVMKTTISHSAPIEERQSLIAEAITTETLKLYRRTNDVRHVKDTMQCRYDAFVRPADRWWLSEEFYGWLVEYALRNARDHGLAARTLDIASDSNSEVCAMIFA